MRAVLIFLLFALLAAPAMAAISPSSATTATVTVLCQNVSIMLLTDKAFYQSTESAILSVYVANNDTTAANLTIMVDVLIIGNMLVYDNISAPSGLSLWRWTSSLAAFTPATYILRARAVLPNNGTLNDCTGTAIEANTSITVVPAPVVVVPPVLPPAGPVPAPVPIPPVAPLPPPPPVIWPNVTLPPEPGVYTLTECAAALMAGNITAGVAEPGTIGVVLCPVVNYTIDITKITAIEPLTVGRLACMQRSLAGYEIDVKANIAALCMDYGPWLDRINESSIYIYRYSAGQWRPLPAGQVWSEPGRDLICGNITGLAGKYMIAGTTNKTPLVSQDIALAAIQRAERIIRLARTIKLELPQAMQTVAVAWNAFFACDFDLAKQLADRAYFIMVRALLLLILLLILLVLLVLTKRCEVCGHMAFSRCASCKKPLCKRHLLLRRNRYCCKACGR